MSPGWKKDDHSLNALRHEAQRGLFQYSLHSTKSVSVVTIVFGRQPAMRKQLTTGSNYEKTIGWEGAAAELRTYTEYAWFVGNRWRYYAIYGPVFLIIALKASRVKLLLVWRHWIRYL
jgi:hypothetical protein